MADDPELRRLLDEVQRRELDPLTAVREILEKVFHIGATRTAPTLADIEAARARLDGVARVTPVYRLRDALAARRPRGAAQGGEPAAHRLVQGARRVQPHLDALSEAERAAGVVAASAGNHGQAVAWAAREVGARATHLHAAGRADGEGRRDAALRRRDRARGRLHDRGRARGAQAYVAETGATFVHPFEDPVVIAGQGTIGLELAEQVPDAGRRSSSRSAAAASRPGIALALRALRGRTCGSSACRPRGRCRTGRDSRSPTGSP